MASYVVRDVLVLGLLFRSVIVDVKMKHLCIR